jgi:hypothetical protein
MVKIPLIKPLDPWICPRANGEKCKYYNWHGVNFWECMNGFMEARLDKNVPCKVINK